MYVSLSTIYWFVSVCAREGEEATEKERNLQSKQWRSMREMTKSFPAILHSHSIDHSPLAPHHLLSAALRSRSYFEQLRHRKKSAIPTTILRNHPHDTSGAFYIFWLSRLSDSIFWICAVQCRPRPLRGDIKILMGNGPSTLRC